MAANCPRCGASVPDLIKIEAGLKLRIQELQVGDALPPEVCVNCFKQLTSLVSKGAKLRAEINAKEHNKKILWKNRVTLVKSARERMAVKAFAEAAVLYEKYIRTLEISQDQEAGQLNPDVFNNPTLHKELTLIASVYWDLVRIYDTRPSYSAKMRELCGKLLRVLPMTPAGGDIVSRAERFSKIANNEDVIKEFLREARKYKSTKCFIANATFDSPNAKEVQLLSAFRDQVLQQTGFGRWSIRFYYKVSPRLAEWILKHPKSKPYFQKALRPIALRLAKTFNLKSGLEL